MASDPSLIEISGEDDSLLQQIPTDDVARNFFSCSPLQIHGSKPRVPPVDGVNKENVNLNKYEILKLGLEPQHMKRKKKGGGYNLRKSLAWDRAFFTEEGFLDPVELSMISGTSGSSTGEKLPAIHEEGGESLSEFPNSQSDSGDVLALKEKLFKELPVNTTNESRTKHSSSPHQRDALTKCDRALVSSTKRKVLSNYDVNGSRSKRNGSSQSTALSSLIKPVNVNSTNVASKEVNASKKPATKPGSSLRAPTAKIALRVGQPKHSQLAKSGTADKKNAGLKISSSIKTHSEPSTPAGPSSKPPRAKSIVPQSKRNLGKSASRPTSLTRGNDSSQEIEGRKDPSARDNGARSIKVEAAHPEKARLTGGSIQHVQLKAAKPSGLRMPSPSLGFFGQQPKASTKGLLNSYTQPSYDPQSTTGSSKSHRAVNPLSELKPPHVHEKVQKMTIDDTNSNMGLSTEVSAKSLNPEYQKQNADPESQNISKMKVKIQLDTLENLQKIHGFLEDGSEGLHRHMELHKIGIKPQAEDRNMSVGYDTPLSHMGPCGKEKESNYKKNHTIGSQCVEGPSKVLAGDAIVFSHSRSADSSVGRIQSSFGLPDHQLHCAEGVSEFSEKVKPVESHIYDNDRTSIVNQENQARFMGVGSSEELQQKCEECTDNSNDQDDNGNKEKTSGVLPLKLAEQADNGICGLHDSSTESYIENSENLVFYGSLTASHGGTSPAGDHAAEQVTCENTGAKENDELLVGAKCTMTINEQPEVHAVEQVAYAKERAIENDGILLIDFRTGGECQDNALMIEYSPLSCQHACEVLLNSSTALSPVPPSENVRQSDKAKRVVLYAEENQSAQQESEPMVENSASFSDRQSTDNMYLPGQVDAFNLGSSLTVNGDPKTVAATDDTSPSFVGLGIDCCSGVKEEDRYVSTPLVSVVQDGDDTMLMELKECDDVEVLLNSSTALCPEPPSENVHQSDKAKRVVLYAEENQSAQQESEPLVENSAFFSDRQSTDNMYLPGQVNAFNVGSSLMVNRDPKTVAATDDTSASFVGLGSDRCSGVKAEDRYVSAPLVSVVEDGDDNMLMELECDDVEALLNSSTALSPEPPSENVHQSDKAKKVVLYAEENQSAQQESEPMVENSASFSDRRSTDNMYLPGRVDAFNPGSSLMVNRDPKRVAATDDTSASFVGLGSDRYSGVKEEDRYVSTPLVSVVLDGDDNMLMDLKECDDVEERQILQSEKNASASLVTGRLLPDSLTGTELLSREVDNSSHEDRHSGYFGQHLKLKDCYLPNVSVHVEDPSWQDDVDQTNEELHSFDNAMKNSSAVVGQQQLLDGSSFIDCSLKMNGLAGDDNFSVASNRKEQSCYQPELHDPCFTAEFDSHTHQGLSSNDEISTVDNYLKEPKSCFASSCSLCQDDVCSSECPKADICSQVEPVLQDNCGDIGTIYEDPNVEDVLSVSVQNNQSNIYNASLEDNAAVDVNIEEFSEAGVNVMVSSCQSSDEGVLDVKNDEAELPINNHCTEEASQLKSSILPEKADSNVPRESLSYDVRRLHHFGSTLNSCKDTTTLVQGEICKKDGKQESAMVKPPPDAPPFSEEWLAAFEAAGEEILTMKCGAVQNSPPDKTLPEPSPWSPVKRKNNQAIGPYDCTKFTNVCNNIPESSSE